VFWKNLLPVDYWIPFVVLFATQPSWKIIRWNKKTVKHPHSKRRAVIHSPNIYISISRCVLSFVFWCNLMSINVRRPSTGAEASGGGES